MPWLTIMVGGMLEQQSNMGTFEDPSYGVETDPIEQQRSASSS